MLDKDRRSAVRNMEESTSAILNSAFYDNVADTADETKDGGGPAVGLVAGTPDQEAAWVWLQDCTFRNNVGVVQGHVMVEDDSCRVYTTTLEPYAVFDEHTDKLEDPFWVLDPLSELPCGHWPPKAGGSILASADAIEGRAFLRTDSFLLTQMVQDQSAATGLPPLAFPAMPAWHALKVRSPHGGGSTKPDLRLAVGLPVGLALAALLAGYRLRRHALRSRVHEASIPQHAHAGATRS
jgi:hypothetical protein